MTQNHHEAIIDNVREMISTLPCVQTMLGVGNSTDALDHIYFFSAKDDGTENPPRYVVNWEEGEYDWERKTGQMPVWVTSQWIAPGAQQGDESAEARWASGQHQTMLNEIRTYGANVMLADSTDNVFRVPHEEVPPSLGSRYVWESFIRFSVRR